MFVIKPENAADWQHAMFMLSDYHVECKLYSDGENAESTYMVVEASISTKVDEHRDEEALRLAEGRFQMNWHQVGMICPHCEDMEGTTGPVEAEPGKLSARGILNDLKQWYGTDDGFYELSTCGHLTFSKPIDTGAFDKIFG